MARYEGKYKVEWRDNSFRDTADTMEQGVLYRYDKGYSNLICNLVCPCGCGELLPLTTKNHTLEVKEGVPTLNPSLLVKWENSDSSDLCGSHFWIKNGQIEWCE